MAEAMRVGLVQINSQEDKERNIDRALELAADAVERGAGLIALPECVSYLGRRDGQADSAEPIPGPTSERFAAFARANGVYFLGGSVYERSNQPGMSYNTSVLYDRSGGIAAIYRKIHLFDIDITGNVSANESAMILPGNEVVTTEIDGYTAGMTICYDVRFPELYRLLAVAGAELFFVPAAFTMFTGKDHWHALLRARAIENQAFVIAPAQVGPHPPDGQCYGHSLVVDPWGTVLADAPNVECAVVADLDFEYLRKVRRQVPSLANRRPSAYREPAAAAV